MSERSFTFLHWYIHHIELNRPVSGKFSMEYTRGQNSNQIGTFNLSNNNKIDINKEIVIQCSTVIHGDEVSLRSKSLSINLKKDDLIYGLADINLANYLAKTNENTIQSFVMESNHSKKPVLYSSFIFTDSESIDTNQNSNSTSSDTHSRRRKRTSVVSTPEQISENDSENNQKPSSNIVSDDGPSGSSDSRRRKRRKHTIDPNNSEAPDSLQSSDKTPINNEDSENLNSSDKNSLSPHKKRKRSTSSNLNTNVSNTDNSVSNENDSISEQNNPSSSNDSSSRHHHRHRLQNSEETPETHQNETHQNETHQNETYQNEAHQNETHQNETHQNETYQNEAHQNETHQNETHQNETHQNETHQNETHQNETYQNEAHQNETHQNETHQNETHQNETHQIGKEELNEANEQQSSQIDNKQNENEKLDDNSSSKSISQNTTEMIGSQNNRDNQYSQDQYINNTEENHMSNQPESLNENKLETGNGNENNIRKENNSESNLDIYETQNSDFPLFEIEAFDSFSCANSVTTPRGSVINDKLFESSTSAIYEDFDNDSDNESMNYFNSIDEDSQISLLNGNNLDNDHPEDFIPKVLLDAWHLKTMYDRKAICVAYKAEVSRESYFSSIENDLKEDEETRRVRLARFTFSKNMQKFEEIEQSSEIPLIENVKKRKIRNEVKNVNPILIFSLAIRFIFYIGYILNLC